MLNVHLLYEYTPQVIDYLQAQLDPQISLSVGEIADDTSNYHILIAGRPKRKFLSASRILQTLIIPWTGLPPETRDLLAEFPHVAVHNLHHNAAPVAEMAVTLLLSAAKYVIPFDRALRQGDWTLRYARPYAVPLLSKKTALILGYGEIGRRVARICRSMDLTVVAIKRKVSCPNDQFAHEIHPLDKLNDLLPRAEVLIIALPLTPSTENLIGKHELAQMPPNSVLVNIGRGPIVNEEALYKALKGGSLGAAGLDVWYNYPNDEENRKKTTPSNYPFWELENVVLSPHRGGSTMDTDLLRMDHLAILLNAAANHEQIPNRVDLHTGY